MMLTLGPRTHIQLSIEDDEQADRVMTLLDALGYEVERAPHFDSRQARLQLRVDAIVEKDSLTPREAEVLGLFVHGGLLNIEIAKELGVELSTVKWHMHNIFTKTDTKNREALLRAVIGDWF
ncbi:helix-turn-helix domain-containing protein [Plesiocystis pacifica]|nr:helix-turn-helix transcriptional regulator [Plesiocystis pacifica]